MSDPIRIAYSWIGPRGPMINTELPNIFHITFGQMIYGGEYSMKKEIMNYLVYLD